MQEIEISKLRIHPKNMRTTYEGIEELTESIKSNGILQNLTVVPDPIEEGYYLVVIGNRRLTAARKAGLKTAPCVVVDLPEKEQLAMMLSENMQRKDMDIIDECKGVQMTLEMGFDVDALAKKTGLSKKTIIRRKNIADMELNYSEVRHRQITIGDLEQLQRVKNADIRQVILGKIGTDDFGLEIAKYEQKEKFREWKNKMLTTLRGVAEEVTKGLNYREYTTIDYFNMNSEKKWENVDIKEDYKYFCYFAEENKMMYLYGVAPKNEEPEEEEETEEEVEEGTEEQEEKQDTKSWREEAEERRRKEKEREAKEKEMGELFFRMRMEFIVNHSAQKFLSQRRALYWLTVCSANYELSDSLDEAFYAELIGDEEPDSYSIEPEEIAERIMKETHEAIPYIYAILELTDEFHKLPINWNGIFQEKHRFHTLYQFMKDIGYTISSEEQKVLEGRHEIFKEG